VLTIFGYSKSSFQSADTIAKLLGKMNDEVVLCEEREMLRPIACGFTADIDVIASLSQKFYEEIKEQARGRTPEAVIHSWDDFCSAVDWNVQKGSGAEYIVADQTILKRLEKNLKWRKAIGGGGLQAGCVASSAGYGALVNVPIHSLELTALVSEYKGLTLLSDQEGEVPRHYILEYGASGSTNRIIFRKEQEYPRDMIAAKFIEKVREKDVSWMLVAGYNAVDGSNEVDSLLQKTIQMLDTLGNKRPNVHLELASIWSLDEQWKIIRTLGGYVHTIGLNEDEYKELLGIKDPLLSYNDDNLLNFIGNASEKLGVSHVILHTKVFSAIQSALYDTSHWAKALMNGNRFAYSRAVTGKICDQETIRKVTADAGLNTRGMKLQELTRERKDITIIPAYIGKTVSSTGLGDTFTAGVLVEAPVIFPGG
jgi:ADP-dependent phosphofructokinase/glucokinase